MEFHPNSGYPSESPADLTPSGSAGKHASVRGQCFNWRAKPNSHGMCVHTTYRCAYVIFFFKQVLTHLLRFFLLLSETEISTRHQTRIPRKSRSGKERSFSSIQTHPSLRFVSFSSYSLRPQHRGMDPINPKKKPHEISFPF